jgi:hypothetical protein
LTGAGRQNGRDIWFMTDNKDLFNYWGWFGEGTQTAVDENNVVTTIAGSFQLLECENCFGDPEMNDYVYWSDKGKGTWTAERMPPEYCGVTPDDDDDTADDDTADDDTTDDDDDDDDDDNDAAGDDDDDDNGCGC